MEEGGFDKPKFTRLDKDAASELVQNNALLRSDAATLEVLRTGKVVVDGKLQEVEDLGHFIADRLKELESRPTDIESGPRRVTEDHVAHHSKTWQEGEGSK